MSAPIDPKAIARLPKWAQDHIKNLQQQRDVAVRELNEWCDCLTPSPVRITEFVCTGEKTGPSFKTRYIQTRKVEVLWRGVDLQLHLSDEDSQNGPGIHIGYSAENTSYGAVLMQPVSFQRITIRAMEDKR